MWEVLGSLYTWDGLGLQSDLNGDSYLLIPSIYFVGEIININL